MVKWIHRDISDNVLRGFFLVFQVCRKQKDGVVIANRCLKDLLHRERIHLERVNSLARDIEHLFPFHRVDMDRQNATILVLGLKSNEEPKTTLWVQQMPSLTEIEKQLGIETVVWSHTWTKPK